MSDKVWRGTVGRATAILAELAMLAAMGLDADCRDLLRDGLDGWQLIGEGHPRYDHLPYGRPSAPMIRGRGNGTERRSH